MPMPDTWFAALVPSVCVTAAALAAMVMEAFRRHDERLPIGALGVIGLIAAMVATVALWVRSYFGGDTFQLFGSDKWMTTIWSRNGIIEWSERWPPDIDPDSDIRWPSAPDVSSSKRKVVYERYSFWPFALATAILPLTWAVPVSFELLRRRRRST